MQRYSRLFIQERVKSSFIYLFIYLFISLFLFPVTVDILRIPVSNYYWFVTSCGCSWDVYGGMITLFTVVLLFLFPVTVDVLRIPVSDYYQFVTSYGCSWDVYGGAITLFTVVSAFVLAFLFLSLAFSYLSIFLNSIIYCVPKLALIVIIK